MATISVEQIAALAGSLGTAEGLARVNAEIASMSLSLRDPQETFSREQLARMINALDFLSAAILAMDRVVREMLGESGAGAIDCVG